MARDVNHITGLGNVCCKRNVGKMSARQVVLSKLQCKFCKYSGTKSRETQRNLAKIIQGLPLSNDDGRRIPTATTIYSWNLESYQQVATIAEDYLESFQLQEITGRLSLYMTDCANILLEGFSDCKSCDVLGNLKIPFSIELFTCHPDIRLVASVFFLT